MIDPVTPMKRLALSVAVGATVLLAGCAPPSSPTAPAPAQESTALQTAPDAPAVPVPGLVKSIGGVMVPLPEGVWKEVGTIDLSPRPRYPTAAHVLVSTTGKAIDRIVVVWEQKASGSGYFNDFKNCDASTNLAQMVASKQARSTDCVYSRTLTWGETGKVSSLLRRYAKSNSLFAPVVTVGPRVALSLSGRHRMAVDYAFNVDLLAPQTDRSIWMPDDWTAKSAKDPTKAAVVRELQEFGERMRLLVKQANAGQG